MPSVKPLYIPPPSNDLVESGTLILRDGTTAGIRLTTPDDRDILRTFVNHLSTESKRHRFFSEGNPPTALIEAWCTSSDPRSQLTLIVIRLREGRDRVIAAGSYFARDETTAEVAMAVDDEFHGKGLGTLLLERLALLAIRHGFSRLCAVTHAENLPMREVFRESGFEWAESVAGGNLEVELSILPTERSVTRAEVRDRVATASSLRPFFQPNSVAVVGASRDPSSIGYRIVEALVMNRFQGPVYPINPKATVVGSIPAYPSVRTLPSPVDLAIVAVPRDAVLGVVDECAERGVRALVVITSGFAEIGAEGRELQDRLVEKARGYGMRLVGPNCMGLLNTDPQVRLNASFAQVFPPAGRIAMLSQSGALGLAILRGARHLHLGLSTFVSVGNKADVSGNDLLQYWEEDPGTDVILLYLESFGNPRRFARIARRVSRHKPIVAVKGGRTTAGHRAAGSHTAALAASDVGVEALFRQTGIIRAETLDEMFALAGALGSQPLPSGHRVAIVTNAGGPAILCADSCESAGLAVGELSDDTVARLQTFLPPAASLRNPVDLIASAGATEYEQAIETVLPAAEVDALILIYIPVDMAGMQQIAEAMQRGIRAARAKGGEGKPVLLCWMAEEREHQPLELETESVPSYPSPERTAQVMGKVSSYAEWRRQPIGMIPELTDIDLVRARDICQRALLGSGGAWLSHEDVREVLESAGLLMPPGGVAKTAGEAASLANKIGFPVVVKLASRRFVHKTEVGAVRLQLQDERSVRDAFEDIRARLAQLKAVDAMDGVVVQPMVTQGVEVMIGVTHDPLFGPLIAFGLGGIHVEILGDVQFRVTPLTERDAAEMIQEIKGHRLLEGYRGHPAADTPALETMLLHISRLVEDVPEIAELDLNPIFALPPGQGCRIVDARIRVARSAGNT